MQICDTGAEIGRQIMAARQSGRRVGFVPTMGALHEGHLSLVDAAAAQCDHVVVSIFVNPSQFGEGEDYTRYPRVLEQDMELLRPRGCDIVFAPAVEEMYPSGFDTTVSVGAIARPWEGEHRPTHFAGVATVVLKLFQLVPAHAAFFGQKDYQQTLVVKQFVRDLHVPIEIVVCPIVRESDGLAMSSRNVYLSATEREDALVLSQSLKRAEALFHQGERNAAVIREAMESLIATRPAVQLQYIAITEDGGVLPIEHLGQGAVIAVAALVGKTRLIDNCRIG